MKRNPYEEEGPEPPYEDYINTDNRVIYDNDSLLIEEDEEEYRREDTHE